MKIFVRLRLGFENDGLDLIQPSPKAFSRSKHKTLMSRLSSTTMGIDSAIREASPSNERSWSVSSLPNAILTHLQVGIKGDELKGPHNDVEDMKRLLMGNVPPSVTVDCVSKVADGYKWSENDIIVLKDDDPKSIHHPTQKVVVCITSLPSTLSSCCC